MQISTFQKIQGKLFNVILLPVTLLASIVTFFSTSFWDHHFLFASLIFAGSFVAFLYFASVNIIEKPLSFLVKMYNDDKKYKTIHKLKFGTDESAKLVAKSQQKKSDKDQLMNSRPQKPSRDESDQSKRISFSLESEQTIADTNPAEYHRLRSNKTQKKTYPSQISHPSHSQIIPYQKQAPHTEANDISNIFSFTSQKSQPFNIQRRAMSPKKQTGFYMDQFDQEEESEMLKAHIEQIFGSQQTIEDKIRSTYEERYQNFKKSLGNFMIDKQFMEKFSAQTKAVLRQKIQLHLKKQFENLDSIDSLLRKNFDAHFTPYKQRSTQLGSQSIYGIGNTRAFGGIYQEASPFNKKQSFSSHQTGKQMSFNEALQQCVNLMHTNYFEFDYVGEPARMNEIKTELKFLIRERIQLDKFLLLRNTLDVGRNFSRDHRDQQRFICEFEQERYLIILKLQTLGSILDQREAAQQNLLKQFFSSHHSSSNQRIEQINDERNIEILMNFYVRTLREKLSDYDNEDLIKVQLSRPNFEDPSANFIWVKRESSIKSHYDIIYSLKRDSTLSATQTSPKTIHCCPGETNIWTCISFMRLLISKIGLKKKEFPMIKDKQLRKDFKRVVELVK